LQPCYPPQAVRPLPTHLLTFAAQEDLDAAVPVTRVLQGEAPPGLQDWPVPFWHRITPCRRAEA